MEPAHAAAAAGEASAMLKAIAQSRADADASEAARVEQAIALSQVEAVQAQGRGPPKYVTREAFRKDFETVVGPAIRKAAFVAVDLEFTGLGRSGRLDLADPQAHYADAKAVAEEYCIAQLGLAVFEPNSNGGLDVQGFTFPFFPHSPDGKRFADKHFMVQSGSLDFLSRNNFDFNSWIKDGIPAVDNGTVRIREEGIKHARALAEETAQAAERDTDAARAAAAAAAGPSAAPPAGGAAAAAPQGSQDIPIGNPRDRQLIDEVHQKVEAWIASGGQGAVQLGRHNSFCRRLIHQEVRKVWGHRRYQGQKRIVTRSAGEEIRAELSELGVVGELRQRVARLEGELWDLKGLRHVVEAIAERQCPVVAHNCLKDLAYLSKWVMLGGSPLPEHISDFANLMAVAFPQLIDVKYLAENHEALRPHIPRNTQVETLFRHFNQERYPLPPIYGLPEDGQAHDAGWDAVMTGATYAKLLEICGGHNFVHDPLAGPAQLAECVNKLWLYGSPVWLSLGAGARQPKVDPAEFLLAVPSDRRKPLLIQRLLGIMNEAMQGRAPYRFWGPQALAPGKGAFRIIDPADQQHVMSKQWRKRFEREANAALSYGLTPSTPSFSVRAWGAFSRIFSRGGGGGGGGGGNNGEAAQRPGHPAGTPVPDRKRGRDGEDQGGVKRARQQ